MDIVVLSIFPLMKNVSHVRRFAGCSRCRAAGFSLVELLVSLAVVVILISLVVPSFQRMRQAGNQAACAGNLRGLIQGWSLYCQDHDGKSVVYGVNEDPSGKYLGWVSQLWPYLGRGDIDRLTVCPSARKPVSSGTRGTSRYAWKYGNMVGSYGFNARWYVYPAGSSSDYDTYNANYYKKQMNGSSKEGPVLSDAAWVDFDRGAGPPSNYETAAGSGSYAIVRHGGRGVNMAFADGSVRLVSMGEVFSTLKLRPNEAIPPGWLGQVPEEYR